MKGQPIIRRFLSFVMIVVMAFTITPKRTIHEIFGCHEKSTETSHHSKQTSISKDGFHCACENQEFQTAFIESITPRLNIPTLPVIIIKSTPLHKDLPVADQYSAYLRGPPSVA